MSCQNHPDREYKWGPHEKKLCNLCYCREYTPLSFVFHRDLEPWVQEKLESEEVQRMLALHWKYSAPVAQVTVHVFSRKEAHGILWHVRWGRVFDYYAEDQREDYSFRAWAEPYKNNIVLLIDDTETPESLVWILFHELGHIEVSTSPLLAAILKAEDEAAGLSGTYNWADDDAHESYAEEKHCNRIATVMAGGNYDRHWWRKRVNQLKENPDVA